jgi:hypothetical protein
VKRKFSAGFMICTGELWFRGLVTVLPRLLYCAHWLNKLGAGRYYAIGDNRIEGIEGIGKPVIREHHVEIKPAFIGYLWHT